MLFESFKTFAIPLIIYVVMGAFITRIQLENTNTHGYRWLKWLQFAVDVLRIVFMWPLVLFIEKSQSWLEKSTPGEEISSTKETTQAHI